MECQPRAPGLIFSLTETRLSADGPNDACAVAREAQTRAARQIARGDDRADRAQVHPDCYGVCGPKREQDGPTPPVDSP